MQPIVTTIIPCYNRAQCIGDAIESALAQNIDGRHEIVVVDDGSDDGSVEVVKKWASNVRLVQQRQNGGPAAARNAGLQIASGKYVAFLDSDDVWLPGKLQEQIQLLETNPDAVLVHCWARSVQRGRNVAPNCYPHSDCSWPDLFHNPLVFTPCVMIRRSTAQLAGYFLVRLKNWEDVNYWLRLAVFGRVLLIDRTLVELRAGASQCSNINHYRKLLYWCDAFSHALEAARQVLGSATYRKSKAYMNSYLLEQLRKACLAGDRRVLMYLGSMCCLRGPKRLRSLAYVLAGMLPAELREQLQRMRTRSSAFGTGECAGEIFGAKSETL